MKKKENKHSFWEKVSYWFDSLMSKGTIAMILLLFIATVIVVVIIGGLASLFFGGGIGNQIWFSLMHALDAGTLAGDGTDNVGFIVLMSIITLFGLFVTSILIGIITTGFENRLNELKKGRSKVIDEGHTIIFGFNEDLYILLDSLIEANANHKHQCIVVAGTEDVETMDAAIKERIDDFKTTHMIMKSGTLSEEYLFERAGVSNARSIILNLNDDKETVKVVLALNHYLEKNPPLIENEHVVVVLNEKKYVERAKIAGGSRFDVIFASDAISRIIAHTCSESGLSNVMTEIFDYEGDELYFEKVPECTGKAFSEILNYFPNQVVFGFEDEKGPHLNPPMDTVIKDGDRIILLEEDDGAFSVSKDSVHVQESSIVKTAAHETRNDNGLVIIGDNKELPAILLEYDQVSSAGTSVTILNRNENEKTSISDLHFKNIVIQKAFLDDANVSGLKGYLRDESKNVLLLTNYDLDPDAADSETILNLIDLSLIARQKEKTFSITSEIRKGENQRVASLVGVDDFIIGSNIVGMMAAQISENRELFPVYHELLTEEGSEIYMKSAKAYVRIGEEVNFYTVTEAAARRSEIAIGYRKADEKTQQTAIVTNPRKENTVVFGSEDMIIVVAEDGTV